MILISLLLIVLCCLIIWRASDGFEVASEYLGRNLNDGVRGATINAIGSSMPELFTTLFFLFVLMDKDGFAGGIGTTAGSAVFNGMIIPAFVILVVLLKGMASSVTVSKKVLLRDGLALLLCELVLILLLGDKFLSWEHGLILMLLYVVYATYMIKTMDTGNNNNNDDEADEDKEGEDDNHSTLYNLATLNLEPILVKSTINSANAWGLLLVTMLIIGMACLLLVKSCEWMGEALEIPIYFIAVILASAATSVPDTILSIKDAQKGNYDDAVANALGSNIFDVCFALGLPLFIFCLIYGPIEMSAETVVNISELRILLFVLTAIAFGVYIYKEKLTYINAFLLLFVYALFAFYIFGKSLDASYANVIAGYLEHINHFIDTYLRFWK